MTKNNDNNNNDNNNDGNNHIMAVQVKKVTNYDN